ncbi:MULTISPECIES: hypothetical protein [Bradyrhizobium]|uniref:Uncharacterized protein n=3 Tax=Bradyrhizobium TaxID=374 RepID=A0A939RPT4_9BRAD|nr:MULTISPECIES: hypothetical protein [Bradyrhizobium]UFX44311.1 hypothetical protein HAP47_0035470 [Bradyrhizobium sp. 41S5]UGA44275.1 hypothetical protein HU230_0039760 [Bradyrhizobium quebecense]UGY00517.1 hypothetical protein J4P68_0025065 [Bradyrhizobium quebecense]
MQQAIAHRELDADRSLKRPALPKWQVAPQDDGRSQASRRIEVQIGFSRRNGN